MSNSKSGYESLVEAAMVASQKFSPIQQKEVVLKALDTAFPKPILSFVSLISCFHFLLKDFQVRTYFQAII